MVTDDRYPVGAGAQELGMVTDDRYPVGQERKNWVWSWMTGIRRAQEHGMAMDDRYPANAGAQEPNLFIYGWHQKGTAVVI